MSSRHHPQPAADGANRRASRRRAPAEVGLVSARLIAGSDVRLLDVSSGGARFESGTRLMPGSRVNLRLVSPHKVYHVVGRVVRSRVSNLGGDLVYESAIQFDKTFPLLTEERTEGAEPPLGPPASEREHPATPEIDALPHLTAVLASGDPDLAQILEANRW